MITLSIGVFFRGFNASRFVLYACILLFTILLALRLDNEISISYFLVFAPLFMCNLIVFIGAVIGTISFIRRPPQSSEAILRLEFFSMLFTTVQHAVLACFEFLAADKLQITTTDPEYKFTPEWIVVFSPLFLQCILSLFILIWKSYCQLRLLRTNIVFPKFELFFFCNTLQFAFVAMKLDKNVEWSWAVVFIPLWVVLSLSVVGVLYALILALLLTRSRHLLPAHRRNHLYAAILQTLLVVPALISLVLLTGKLDDTSSVQEITFVMAVVPLIASLGCLLLMSFCTRGGNVWWFALRRPFCAFVLDACPCLKQYANVSYKVGAGRSERGEAEAPPLLEEECRALRPVVPITTIELPD